MKRIDNSQHISQCACFTLGILLSIRWHCCTVIVIFCAEFQVRRVTLAYQEALVFLAYLDRQETLVAGVQMAFLDWMDDQVFIAKFYNGN